MWFSKKKEQPVIPREVNKEVSKEVLVANAIASEFRNGEITASDLSPFGISELSVRIDGIVICISWYSGRNRFRDIAVSDGKFIATSKAAEIILEAALARSEVMLSERLESIGGRILESVTDKGDS